MTCSHTVSAVVNDTTTVVQRTLVRAHVAVDIIEYVEPVHTKETLALIVIS